MGKGQTQRAGPHQAVNTDCDRLTGSLYITDMRQPGNSGHPFSQLPQLPLVLRMGPAMGSGAASGFRGSTGQDPPRPLWDHCTENQDLRLLQEHPMHPALSGA